MSHLNSRMQLSTATWIRLTMSVNVQACECGVGLVSKVRMKYLILVSGIVFFGDAILDFCKIVHQGSFKGNVESLG